jgi:uncharacterized protein (DUF2249 family)
MREGEMSWEYIERGPETFSIRITRITPPASLTGFTDKGMQVKDGIFRAKGHGSGT